METAANDAVLYEVRDHVAIITLNRPEAMNAINGALAGGLARALHTADKDADVRVVVMTGNGRAFCAGMDLKAFAAGEALSDPDHPEFGFEGIIRRPIAKPLIAAVNGFAMGGGAELVLTTDLAVAAKSATFGLPEVKRGLIAAGGGVLRLPRQIPFRKAMEIALTGRKVSADEAAELGLVNKVVEDDELLAATLALAAEIVANAPLAVRATKQMIYDRARFGSERDTEIWEAHDATVLPVFATKDAREGAVAFAEKRDPVWRGE